MNKNEIFFDYFSAIGAGLKDEMRAESALFTTEILTGRFLDDLQEVQPGFLTSAFNLIFSSDDENAEIGFSAMIFAGAGKTEIILRETGQAPVFTQTEIQMLALQMCDQEKYHGVIKSALHQVATLPWLLKYECGINIVFGLWSAGILSENEADTACEIWEDLFDKMSHSEFMVCQTVIDMMESAPALTAIQIKPVAEETQKFRQLLKGWGL